MSISTDLALAALPDQPLPTRERETETEKHHEIRHDGNPAENILIGKQSLNRCLTPQALSPAPRTETWR